MRGLRKDRPSPEDARSCPQCAPGAGNAGRRCTDGHRTALAPDERSAEGHSWLSSYRSFLAL
jgi:hypothetical protein